MVVLVWRSNLCAQNRYTYVKNSLYQTLYTHAVKNVALKSLRLIAINYQ